MGRAGLGLNVSMFNVCSLDQNRLKWQEKPVGGGVGDDPQAIFRPIGLTWPRLQRVTVQGRQRRVDGDQCQRPQDQLDGRHL
jgi:hypothetical protein